MRNLLTAPATAMLYDG